MLYCVVDCMLTYVIYVCCMCCSVVSYGVSTLLSVAYVCVVRPFRIWCLLVGGECNGNDVCVVMDVVVFCILCVVVGRFVCGVHFAHCPEEEFVFEGYEQPRQ